MLATFHSLRYAHKFSSELSFQMHLSIPLTFLSCTTATSEQFFLELKIQNIDLTFLTDLCTWHHISEE